MLVADGQLLADLAFADIVVWVPSSTGLACGSMALAQRAWGVGHG